ncbi:SE1561 family protein [Aquibacillus saliphilus]|nr:SE1561 family protein [Aquibacillus saliphilus]
MNQQGKVAELKNHLAGFMERLENMDPSETSLEDIDELIRIVEKMEENLK